MNSGVRFSMNAFGPSLASSEAKTAAPTLASSAQQSSSCLPSESADRLQHGLYRERAVGRDQPGELVCLRQGLAVGDDVADQAELLRLRRP